jgi:hypothetical protein
MRLRAIFLIMVNFLLSTNSVSQKHNAVAYISNDTNNETGKILLNVDEQSDISNIQFHFFRLGIKISIK